MTVKGYQQSNLVDYYLGDSMTTPPTPDITLIEDTSSQKTVLPPFKPQYLDAVLKSDTVELSWNPVYDSSIVGYNIYRSNSNNSNYIKLNSSLLSGTNYMDATVVYETLYYYAVTAVDTGDNESDFSNEVYVYPSLRPVPPMNLSVKDAEDSVTIRWKNMTGQTVEGCNIYRRLEKVTSYVKLNPSLIEDTEYLDLDIENGLVYYYAVTCVDKGLESEKSEEIAGMPGIKVTLEAENAELGGGSSADTDHDYFSGTAFVNFPSSGGYVEFSNISGGNEGGDYILRLRHALGNTSRKGLLIVKSVSQNLTMAGTGDLSVWIYTDIPVTLLPGTNNVIRFESTGSDFGNLDLIMLLPYKSYVSAKETFSQKEEYLLQNYPNPFNTETIIHYNLPQSEFVTVRVYDVLGHMVSELVHDYQQEGNHFADWNGADNSGNLLKAGFIFMNLQLAPVML